MIEIILCNYMIEEDKETEVGFEFGTLLEFAGAFIANFRNS